VKQATEHRRSSEIAVENITLNESRRDIDRTNLSGVTKGNNAFLLAGYIVAGNGGCTWFVRVSNQICMLG